MRLLLFPVCKSIVLLTVVQAVAGCSRVGSCWGLKDGDRLAIDLVELYTPASSYTYEEIPLSTNAASPVSQFPSCGLTFDFQVGETLHVTTIGQSSDDDPKVSCTKSLVRVDSPERLGAQVASNPVLGLAANSVLFGDDDVVVGGCPGRRKLSVVSLNGDPGSVADPMPGQTPPQVLVRFAAPLDEDASVCASAFPAPGLCADEFVVRVTRE
jgi:hypothetical protein